jgi:hypothetical protein
MMQTYQRITKQAAFKLFVEGKSITLCPCKVVPTNTFASQSTFFPESIAEWKEHAARYAPDGILPSSELWEGSIDATAWNLMYKNWAFYNVNYELGKYAHYYIIID